MDRETWPIFRLKVPRESCKGYVVYMIVTPSVNTTFHKFKINIRRHNPGTILWLTYNINCTKKRVKDNNTKMVVLVLIYSFSKRIIIINFPQKKRVKGIMHSQ